MRPIRTCIGCGARVEQEELLRLHVGADGLVHVDLRRRSGGRGAHVHAREDCVRKAASPRAIGRAFRGKAKAPAEDVLVAEVRGAASSFAAQPAEVDGGLPSD